MPSGNLHGFLLRSLLGGAKAAGDLPDPKRTAKKRAISTPSFLYHSKGKSKTQKSSSLGNLDPSDVTTNVRVRLKNICKTQQR